VSYLLADLARTITLLPGDLILTGTPATPAPWYLATWSQLTWQASESSLTRWPKWVF